jgi:phosphoglycerate dehydrogenase-like enzyme
VEVPVLRCAILDDYQNVALSMAEWSDVASDVDLTVFTDHIPDRGERIAALRDFDIIVAMRERTPFDAALIAALPKLRLLVTTGGRNASIDLTACKAHGITVSSTGGLSGRTAELAWALILALARNIPAEVSDFKAAAKWQPRLSYDVFGKQLGIIGLGGLGSRVARAGVAFDMNVVAWSRSLTAEAAQAAGATLAPSLDVLLQTSDYISIHAPLNDSSRGMIGARELGLMKPTAFLVNTSRGPIVDEAALIDALNGNRLAGAAIDVFDIEPLPADHPLRSVERLIATPHIGYVTYATYEVFYRGAVESIAAWLKGAPIRPLTQQA